MPKEEKGRIPQINQIDYADWFGQRNRRNERGICVIVFGICEIIS
jgi:hypothetical protein